MQSPIPIHILPKLFPLRTGTSVTLQVLLIGSDGPAIQVKVEGGCLVGCDSVPQHEDSRGNFDIVLAGFGACATDLLVAAVPPEAELMYFAGAQEGPVPPFDALRLMRLTDDNPLAVIRYSLVHTPYAGRVNFSVGVSREFTPVRLRRDADVSGEISPILLRSSWYNYGRLGEGGSDPRVALAGRDTRIVARDANSFSLLSGLFGSSEFRQAFRPTVPQALLQWMELSSSEEYRRWSAVVRASLNPIGVPG